MESNAHYTYENIQTYINISFIIFSSSFRSLLPLRKKHFSSLIRDAESFHNLVYASVFLLFFSFLHLYFVFFFGGDIFFLWVSYVCIFYIFILLFSLSFLPLVVCVHFFRSGVRLFFSVSPSHSCVVLYYTRTSWWAREQAVSSATQSSLLQHFFMSQTHDF